MDLAQDVRFSFRMLVRTPVVTLVAILSLALGIGANTAIFSVMNALILRSLPIQDAAQLVRLRTTISQDPERWQGTSLDIYRQLRRDQSAFSSMFVWSGGGINNISANGVRYVGGLDVVDGDYFSALGVKPVLGRLIAREDLSLDSGFPAPVAVINYACWQRRFNGDPNVLGKVIRVDDRPYTIIGVTPESFTALSAEASSDVTLPIGYSGKTSYRDRKYSGLEVFGRLKPGASLEQARAQLQSIWPRILEASVPEDFVGAKREAFLSQRLLVDSEEKGESYMRRQYAKPIYVLMVMVGFVLLIACLNLANLMLARAAGRGQEFGIRLALGAARSRLISLMLTESLMLSLMGAAFGLVIAYWASRLLLNMMWTALIPLGIDGTPDLRVLGFTALVSIVTGLLFGIAPAWNVFRSAPSGSLRQNTRSVRGGSSRLSRILISGQVALSILLVIGAVLFVRSLDKLRTVDLGYKRDGILMLHLFPQSGPLAQKIPNRTGYYRELAERLSQIPGVESASYSHMGPVMRTDYTEPASVTSSQAPPLPAAWDAVAPGFFHLAGMRLLAGRDFDWRDDEAAAKVVVISDSLSQRLFPAGDAPGKFIDFGGNKNMEVIGVVSNASLWSVRSHEPLAGYTALMQRPEYNNLILDIRANVDLMALAPVARRVLESMGRHFPLTTETLEQRSDRFLGTDRLIALLSAFFGGLALLLAAVGLYGLMSYAVARRTSEIGVRMALGARSSSVQSLILKDVLWLVLAGMAVGIPAALIAARLVSNMVFGVAVNDSLTIGMSSAILLMVAAVAGYVPARRASRIDPMTALRSE